MKYEKIITIAGCDFRVRAETEADCNLNLSVQQETVIDLPDTYLMQLRIQSPTASTFHINSLEIAWQLPIVDMHGLYLGGDPRAELGYLPFWQVEKEVCANAGLPYLSLIHRSGENRAAFGLLDQLTETTLQAELSEITRSYHMTFQKPSNHKSNGQQLFVEGVWEETLFISFAHRPWQNVLQQFATTVTQATMQPLLPVPETAFNPVFCTWTAIHHDVSHDWIMKNAALAADLGFKTWLTDDGWFLDNGQFGNYEHVGAWQPSLTKFPEFREHVRAVQALGFQYVLWVAPFMIGVNSRVRRDVASFLVTGQPRERFDNLSPWHAETATFVRDLLTRLVNDYGLDGLKIDFIDSISPHSEKRAGSNETTLGQSIFSILNDVVQQLHTANPELLIEFRNRYTNLASRHYANLYRSSDVPVNFTLNRWQAVMLRMLAPDRAVHMDPMLWHPNDTDENVAVHLINGIASVPMVSIELDQYPPSHLDLIRYWIGFYNTHRATIMHGDFQPVMKLASIPMIYFFGEDDVIIGLYDDVEVPLPQDIANQWILNASTRDYVILDTSHSGLRRIITHDKFGKIQSDTTFDKLPRRVNIEIGGSLHITY